MIDPAHNPTLAQEEDRLPWATILLVFLVTALVGVLLVVWAFYAMKAREHVLRPSAAFPERDLGPRRNVGGELQELYGGTGPGQLLEQHQRQDLSHFRWVDKAHGIVAIPIDEAMELVARGARP
jgi:hypothetical protein